jgi:cold shock CspA family protein
VKANVQMDKPISTTNRRTKMQNETRTGTVSAFISKGGWGFIANAPGERHWFHVAQFIGAEEPRVGTNVSFQISPIRTGRSITAVNVKSL